jgi:pimeloyl-ACP methyl ester carboxylesterase
LQVHYKDQGQGEPALILLHGFASSLFSWREVTGPLAQHYRVVAYDRPAFGLTERPLQWDGPNPYSPDSQVELLIALMDRLGIEKAILVGNSAGGTVAAQVALKYPERVQALVLVDAAIYSGGGAPAFVRPLLASPQMRHLGPLVARRIQALGRNFAELAWHDPAKITPEVWEGYSKPLQVENWDRALWEMTAASGNLDVARRLSELTLPALVITGDDDRIVPTEQSVRLAGELPQAELMVVPACGHVPHEECPQAFLEAVDGFLARLPASREY